MLTPVAPLLAIRGLNRRFGSHEVVRSLDIDVSPGQRVALAGPNGSGKTTVLRCVAGTVEPSRGNVLVGGHRAGTVRARALLGVSLSQERSFYLRLTGRKNLAIFAGLRGLSRREGDRRITDLEKELELSEILNERADRCSSGMLQQLAFARALLGEPPLLLLDEPTRSLDVDASARLWGALDRRPDACVLLASHLDSDLDRCDVRFELPS